MKAVIIGAGIAGLATALVRLQIRVGQACDVNFGDDEIITLSFSEIRSRVEQTTRPDAA